MTGAEEGAARPTSFGLELDTLALPLDAPGVTRLAEPPEGALALLLAHRTFAAQSFGLIHVAHTEARAERLARAARGVASDLEVVLLPPWDCLPYDRVSPSSAAMGRRAAALGRMAKPICGKGRLVLTTIDASLQSLPPRDVWADADFRFEVGGSLSLDDLRTHVLRTGYRLDERVDEPGEIAIRGKVIDLFPGDADHPYRLVLEEERITGIRRYDALSQRTVAEVDALVLRPASEVVLGDEDVRRFQEREAEESRGDPPAPGAILIGPTEAPRRVGGVEHRLPLFYPHLETLFEYVPRAAVALDAGIEERRAAWLEQIADSHEAHRALRWTGRPGLAMAAGLLEPERLYLSEEEWQRHLNSRSILAFSTAAELRLGAAPVPRFSEEADPPRALIQHIRARRAAGDRVVLAAGTRAERQRLARLVQRRVQELLALIERWADIDDVPPGALALVAVDLATGFSVPGTTVVAARDVYGEPGQAARGTLGDEALTATD